MPYIRLHGEAYREREECGIPAEQMTGWPPEGQFSYNAPWQATTATLPFPATPGPEPELAENAGVLEQFEAAAARGLWQVSAMTATCRNLGVKRVFGSYNGGGDESFTHYQGVETSDGRVIPVSPALRTMADALRGEPHGIDYDELVENAVAALMGHFGIGPYSLRGVVIIDFDACTITDEQNPDVVLGDRMPWDA